MLKAPMHNGALSGLAPPSAAGRCDPVQATHGSSCVVWRCAVGVQELRADARLLHDPQAHHQHVPGRHQMRHRCGCPAQPRCGSNLPGLSASVITADAPTKQMEVASTVMYSGDIVRQVLHPVHHHTGECFNVVFISLPLLAQANSLPSCQLAAQAGDVLSFLDSKMRPSFGAEGLCHACRGALEMVTWQREARLEAGRRTVPCLHPTPDPYTYTYTLHTAPDPLPPDPQSWATTTTWPRTRPRGSSPRTRATA